VGQARYHQSIVAQTVTDPDGKTWTVRRRWFPWRRALSLRSLWHSTPEADKPSAATPQNSTESGNLFLTIVVGTIGGLLWLIITAGKAVLTWPCKFSAANSRPSPLSSRPGKHFES
jgi:hypothetical protein